MLSQRQQCCHKDNNVVTKTTMLSQRQQCLKACPGFPRFRTIVSSRCPQSMFSQPWARIPVLLVGSQLRTIEGSRPMQDKSCITPTVSGKPSQEFDRYLLCIYTAWFVTPNDVVTFSYMIGLSVVYIFSQILSELICS